MLDRIRYFARELKRRHVVQTTGVYLVARWGLSAGAADIFDAIDLPPDAARFLILGLFSLTPVVAALSWMFEIDRSGVHFDTRVSSPGGRSYPSPEACANSGVTVSYEGSTRSFSSSFTIGRDDQCDFQIVDPQISRRHTHIELIAGNWLLRDLGSANGTFVNGVRVDALELAGVTKVTFYDGSPVLTVTVLDTTAETRVFHSAETQLGKDR